MISSPSRRKVVVNAPKASICSDLELTSRIDCSFSVGSTVSGDSFVLAIDWDDESFRNDVSFDDPYLIPKEEMRERQDQAVQVRLQQERQRIAAMYPIDETEENKATPAMGTECSDSTREPSTSPVALRNLGGFSFALVEHIDVPLKARACGVDEVSIASEAYEVETAPSTPTCSVPASPTRSSSWAPNRECAQRDQALMDRIACYGFRSLQAAEAMIELGNAHLRIGEFDVAAESFENARHVYSEMKRPLGVAKTLFRLGAVCLAMGGEDDARGAVDLFLEALWIRHDNLDPWHVDTIETMNQLGHAYRQSNDLENARKCFWQVFWIRRAIFGGCHPGVAIAAHDLANTLFCTGAIDDARNFYQIAMGVYEDMDLPFKNPSVVRLRRDMQRVDRVEGGLEV